MKIFKLLETQYNKFTNTARAYISKTLSKNGETYGNSTIFGQFINVLASAVQNIMLYIEDSLVEQNKYTAQRKKSIYGLAAISGYEPSYGKAAGVEIKLNFIPNNEDNTNIVLKNHETLTCTQNGLQYNIILPQEAIVLSLANDASSKFFYCAQGNFETQEFISTGGKYYTQNFKFLGNMDVDYMEVKINNEPWECCASIYDMNPDGKQFTYKTSAISGIDLIFGNDVHGRSLQPNDIITVNYLVHDGESGNLDPNLETYFVFNENLIDVSGNEVNGNNIFNVTFAINDPVTSGTNSESIDQVKEMIGLNSRSLVLASADNYKNFINKFSFCGYNRTWSDPGSLVINSLIMKNYKQSMQNSQDYFKLNEVDFKLSDVQKQSIINCLEKTGNQLAGVKYNIFDPELCKYALYLYIKPKSSSYDREYITNKIRILIGDFFSNINSDIFIPKSDIVHLIKSNIDEIDSVDAYFLSQKNEDAIINKAYDKIIYNYNPATGTYNKKTEHITWNGEYNPNLGLDNHGNIYLDNNDQFPVLMGGWKYKNKKQEGFEDYTVEINDPLIIVFE